MDFFTGLVIAGLIGNTIWEALRGSPEERRIRERRERIAEQKRIRQLAVEEQNERKRHEAEEAARREDEGPFETSLECFSKQYVSYSRIATYNSCPHRFKLIYLDKKSVIDYGYFDEGSAFHEVMRKRFWSSVGRVVTHLDYDSMAKMNRRYLDRRYVSWRVNTRNRRNRLRFTCKTFPKNVEIVAVEKELSFKVNNVKFYGIVDLVLKYPDGTIEIVDYKTGHNRLPVREQLEIYSIPFTRLQDFSKVDFRVICPDRQSHYRWSLNRKQTVERRTHILSLVNTILNDRDFAPVVSSTCSRCSVGHACKHSEIYSKTKRISGRNNQLTKLTFRDEWKQGVTPPRKARPKLERRGGTAKKEKKFGSGSSYSLSRAKNKYRCLKTGRPIEVGEYHFVNHGGKRYSIDAFTELCPERAWQLMHEGKQASVAERKARGFHYSIQRAAREYKCHHTGRTIHIGDDHFANQRGIRLCKNALAELYPERAIDCGCRPVKTRTKSGVKVEAEKRNVEKPAEKVKDEPYVGSKMGRIFHLPRKSCTQYLESGNTIRFGSIEAAAKRGYKPCLRCKPSQKREAERVKGSPYIGSKAGRFFHRPGRPCTHWMKPENTIRFGSRKDAVKKGYKPCPRCKP